MQVCVHFPVEKAHRLHCTFKKAFTLPQKGDEQLIQRQGMDFKVLLVANYKKNDNDNNFNRVSWKPRVSVSITLRYFLLTSI
jgi:hypothetical protein